MSLIIILFFKTSSKQLAYILLLLVIHFISFNYISASDKPMSNSMVSRQHSSTDIINDSNSELNDSGLPESDITTKIYRSTDNSNEIPHENEIELDSATDVDVVNKEDLIYRHSHLRKRFLNREKVEHKSVNVKPANNSWLPWFLLVVVLLLFAILIKAIKQIKI